MVSFEGFRPEGEAPIYLQLVRHVKHLAASGAVSDGEELPSRRVVSALLGINPNTVQRAFSQLEDEGLVVSRAGAKSRMQLDGERLARIKNELLGGEFARAVEAMRKSGLSLEQAHGLLDEIWKRESEEHEQE